MINYTSGKWILVLFAVTNSIYLAMLFYSIPLLMEYSGGLPIFDISPSGYNYQQAIALLSALGEKGRSVYLFLQLTLDLFYPLLFAICYCALCRWLISKGELSSRIWRYLSVVPVFVCMFDYAENMGIYIMLTEYPSVSNNLVVTSSIFTLLKSALTTLYFTGLLLAMCITVFRKLQKRKIKGGSMR